MEFWGDTGIAPKLRVVAGVVFHPKTQEVEKIHPENKRPA